MRDPEVQRLSEAVLESAQAVVKAFEKRPPPGTPEFKALQALLQADIAINVSRLPQEGDEVKHANASSLRRFSWATGC
jgi:hypothetical protein